MNEVLFVCLSFLIIACDNNATSSENSCNENTIDMCGFNCGDNNCIIGTWINANNQNDIFEINSNNIIFYTPDNLDVCNIYAYTIVEDYNICFNNDFALQWGSDYSPISIYLEVNSNNILSFGFNDLNSEECLIFQYNIYEEGFEYS